MVRKILCLVIIFLMIVTISLADPPPLPNTFSGTVKLANSNVQYDAPVGTQIEALIDNVTKGNTTLVTAGIYEIDVHGVESDDNKSIIFNVNGRNAAQKAIFNASLSEPSVLNLIVNVSFPIKIDIKPGSFPNSINPKSSGVIPVAILSTGEFNATAKVNIQTVRFGPKGAGESHNQSHFEDNVNNDSHPDLVMHFDTLDTGISCGDTFAILTGKTYDGMDLEGSDSIETVGCQAADGKRDGGGGGGGGGGGTSGESFSNIELMERYDEMIYKDKPASYIFKNASNPVISINITGNVNAGLITTVVEVLKGTSTLVKEAAPGIVYKNLNFWVGTSGFSTSRNIKEATITFRVRNTWIESNVLQPNEIKMVKYENEKWIALETAELSRDGTYTYFNARTNSFSGFAIVGFKAMPSASIQTATSSVPAKEKIAAAGKSVAPTMNLLLIAGVLVMISIIVAIYFWRRK